MGRYEDPVAARRRLQRELRKLRGDAGLTQRSVAAAMDWSQSKVIRIEAGEVGIATNDLRQLLAHYGVTEQARIDALLATNWDSKQQPWADAYRDVLSSKARDYVGYEASAAIIRQFEPLFVPGLLQIEAYTRALLEQLTVPALGEAEVERLMEVRAKRQEVFERSEPPEAFFVVDEAVLRREVGGKQVLINQLDHIQQAARWGSITVQVVPFGAGSYPGMSGAFTLIELQEEDSVLYLESRADAFIKDDPELIGNHLDLFQRLERSVATAPESLDGVLERIKREVAAD